MKKYIHYDTISHLVVGFMETTDEVELRDGLASVDDLFVFDPTQTYFYDTHEQEVLVTVEKPSAFHYWDWTTKSWLPNLDAARESKLQEVTTELNKRLYLPCNGFDADKVSRERISGMIARLQRGDGLPAGWMGWRDASNQQQWATDDAATVLANLASLSRAIEDREQALLLSAWQHKAAINTMTILEDLMNYNINKGWNG